MGADGAAGGDGAAQQGADGQQGGGEQQGGQDFAALTQQLEGLTSSHEESRQALSQISEWIGQQQQGDEGDGEQALDLSFLENETAFADPDQLQRQFSDVVQQAVDQRVQAAVGPLQQAQAEARMEQQARDLVGEYPELGQREVAEQVVGLAAQIAEQNFPAEVAQVLKDSPAWWRQVFLAGRGVEAANSEGAESPNTAVLEGGGGAAPAGGSQDTGPFFGSSEEAKLPF